MKSASMSVTSVPLTADGEAGATAASPSAATSLAGGDNNEGVSEGAAAAAGAASVGDSQAPTAATSAAAGSGGTSRFARPHAVSRRSCTLSPSSVPLFLIFSFSG